MEPEAEKILAVLADGNEHHVRAIAERTGIPIGEVHRLLGALKKLRRASNRWLQRGYWAACTKPVRYIEVDGPLRPTSVEALQAAVTKQRAARGPIRDSRGLIVASDRRDRRDLADEIANIAHGVLGVRDAARAMRDTTQEHHHALAVADAKRLALECAADLMRWIEFHADAVVQDAPWPSARETP